MGIARITYNWVKKKDAARALSYNSTVYGFLFIILELILLINFFTRPEKFNSFLHHPLWSVLFVGSGVVVFLYGVYLSSTHPKVKEHPKLKHIPENEVIYLRKYFNFPTNTTKWIFLLFVIQLFVTFIKL